MESAAAPPARKQELVIVDAASDPGIIGLEMTKRLKMKGKRVENHFVSTSRKHLTEIHLRGAKKFFSTLTKMPEATGSVDVVFARFRVKDVPKRRQPALLREFRRVLKPGGALVVADMVSPKGPVIFSKVSNIPTEQEWTALLRGAGFSKVSKTAVYSSPVDTRAWIASGQITGKQLEAMHENMLGAPRRVKKAFRIREEKGRVKITYPVMILRAVK